jgi:hypothetical protein
LIPESSGRTPAIREDPSMTHPTPGGAGHCIARAMPSSTPLSRHHLDRNILRHGIAARRHRLAELETSMAEACERAAMRGACRNVRMDDCKTWDKATWQRYLEVAARLEPDYLPRMRRLLRDIDRFERLLALPMAAEPTA